MSFLMNGALKGIKNGGALRMYISDIIDYMGEHSGEQITIDIK